MSYVNRTVGAATTSFADEKKNTRNQAPGGNREHVDGTTGSIVSVLLTGSCVDFGP